MSLFQVVFTLGMLLLPAVFMLFYGPRPRPDVDGARVRRLTRLLWGWTGVAVATYGALIALRLSGATAGWMELPRWMTLGRQPDELAWLMFFPLWFCLAMRLLVATRPEAGSAYAQSAADGPVRRSASLRPRDRSSPISLRHWIVGWVILAIATTVVLWRGMQDDGSENAFAVLSLAVAALPLVIGPWGVRMAMREPEPMDARGSAELASAYARHRTAKAWGLYLLCVLLMALACGATVMPMTSGTGALAGGILGSLVGIAGAAFGVTMGNQRMRIRRLLDKLESE